jgi:pectinesterase
MTTFNSYTLLVMGDDIKISNITIQNTSCNEGQAVSLHVEGDRFIIKNSIISGCQDTVYSATNHSRQYFENCLSKERLILFSDRQPLFLRTVRLKV